MRLGTGLFRLGCSPIQKTVVTIFLFHGKRSPVAEALCSVFKQPAMIAASAPIDRIDIAFIMCFLVHKEAVVYRVKRYRKQIATKTLRLVTSSAGRVKFISMDASLRISPATATATAAKVT